MCAQLLFLVSEDLLNGKDRIQASSSFSKPTQLILHNDFYHFIMSIYCRCTL